jgi:2-polyprenyl-3-methyl-5-hydroxy-6-metoxy-1,4-benzoquinol methylase
MTQTNGHVDSGEEALRTKPVACDLCGSSDSVPLFEAKDRLHGRPGVFTYVRCNHCGLVYMNPQIVPEDLTKVYPCDYGPHQAAEKKPRTGRALRAELKRIPFASTLCGELTADRRLLDVGCGAGAFLAKMHAATGCAVHGVDNSEAAVQTAKQMYGIDVFHGTLLDAPFADGSFDAITAWSFLEHVPNPREVVRRISRLLKPGGLCIICVPNVTSFNARVFRDRWYHLDCPRHLHLFSPETLSHLLTESGLAVDRIAFDRSARGLVQSIRYRFGDDRVSLKHRPKRAGTSLLKAVLRPYSLLLAWLKQSDVIVVSARKRSGG